jgi:eukaryotic-like serine/threonine-protein kinase
MDPARWHQVKNLYEAASARPTVERAAFLAEACQDDDDLRREVQRLLEQPLDTGALFDLVDGAPSVGGHDVRDLTGTRLGAFEVRALIGRGGMGEVYRAHDTKLGRDVAIKVLPSAFTADAARLASFEREARVLASLNHPHIAAIHGVEERDGIRGLVLELVEGETLADVLRRSDSSDRPGLRLQEALGYAHQIAEALEAAHEKGITHRDLKPANIAITADGVVKLLDFGIAKVVIGDGPGSDLSHTTQTTIEATRPGLVAGTPRYMSPEQARGKPVDKRTDIWAFGCIVYEMLSRRRAFAGETLPDTITAILDRDPDWSRLPRDTPRKVRRLIQRCLEKDPEQRLRDIADARLELEHVLRAGSRLWIAAAAATAAIVITVAALTLLRDRRPPGPEEWVQLTRFSDPVGQPSLSRDGKMLAFVRGATTFSTSGEIYVKTLADGEAVQLTRDRMNKMSPMFFPDGSRIAYTVLDGGRWDTWQVPLTGGQARPWLENASGLTWTAKDRLMFSEIKNKDLHMAIVTSLENRAEARNVYVPERVSGMAHRSYVSPDGKSALIVEMANGPWIPCRLVSMDGQSPGRQVGPPNAGCTFAAWSPDGKWMYLSSSAGGGSHIWRQRFPDGAPEQITFGPTEEDGIAMSPDGRSFITAVASRQSAVWVHGPAGDRQISLEGFAFDPKFTPDGKKLMYRILKGSSLLEASELRVTHLESGGTEPLLPGISIFGTPSTTYALSQDGRQAAVAGFDAQGECKIWLVPLDGRSPPRAVPLTESDKLGLRGLSPDGRWLVTLNVTKDEESGVIGRSVVARSLAGEGELLLIAPTAPMSLQEMALKWSRDGRTVFFVSAALDRGMQTKTYSFPVAPGKTFPSIPPGGFRSEAEMAKTPGARLYDVYDFAPGPVEGVYAFTRESVQRNLYRVPLR